jgi:hypothetical protein
MKKRKFSYVLSTIILLVPVYLFSQNYEKLIKDYISVHNFKEYKKADLTSFTVTAVNPSQSLNGNVIKFEQSYQGLPIYSSTGVALIRKNNIIYYTDNFIKDYNIAFSTVVIEKEKALQKIANNLGEKEILRHPILGFSDPAPKNSKAAKQRLIYVKDSNNNLQLAYEFVVSEPKSGRWNILVHAATGEIISKISLAKFCNFPPDSYSHDHANMAKIANEDFVEIINKRDIAHSLLLWDNASYNVFKLPTEAPTYGNRSIVVNPWISSASPEGWHSDGTNHYTITRGNNAYAYVETDTLYSPNGGILRNFDYPFNFNGNATNNRDASITNLFYTTNKAHDIFYQLGFTESARNFQQNNFGNGGLGNDFVIAEAQSNGLNDAYFESAPDGTSPSMSMFLWSDAKKLYYNSPVSAVPRQPVANPASFGPPLNAVGITGDVQLASVLSGCSPLPAGSLTNKIALIKGITIADIQQPQPCLFTSKVKNVQNAGAIGALIYKDADLSLPGMTGADPSITIPSELIDNSEGEYIKGLLSSGTSVNVTLKSAPTDYSPDGSFDNGVIIHEYGHGISERLTGTGYNCLATEASLEQMSEGWSDFFALMLTNKVGGNATVPRGIGTYVLGQSPTGAGSRPSKYSPDFSINSYTYASTNGMSNPHDIGFVWTTMLWDLHWVYVEKYGYSSDLMLNTNNGSTRVVQLIIDGLKLQTCNPTFIDGRDAILAADQAATGGMDKCMIWKIFAKRGLGLNASSGSKTNINDQVEDFTIPTECSSLSVNEIKSDKDSLSIYPNPAKDEFYIKFPTKMNGKVNIEIFDISGKLIFSEEKVSPDIRKTISTDQIKNGIYIINVKGLGFEASSKIIIKK